METARSRDKTVLLSAGGTGGHVFPARALAEELLEKGYKVVLATDTRGLKYFDGLEDRVERVIIASGAYQSGLKGKVLGLLSLLKGYFQSHRLISRIKPSIVAGFGGYPSAPAVFAAQHRGIPTLIHEQNAILGMANALLAPRARKIALAVPHTSGLKPEWAGKCIATGNPVRQDIAALASQPYPDPSVGKLCLMVVGGSQGARSFAGVIPQAIVSLPEQIKKNLFVYHQARPENLADVKAIYKDTGIETDIRPFFADMTECLVRTHLLVSRSGASTIAELTAAGRPAIYIPFAGNRDYQQFHNAGQVAREGGARVLEEKDLTVEKLRAELEDLLTHPLLLEKMARQSHILGVTDAAKRLASVVGSLA